MYCSKSIVIGDRVWIGNQATILKGSKVANDSIVSTGSIVTKEFVTSNIIIGGKPAKVLKEDVNWKHERI